MTLTQIEYVLAIAEHGSFVEAARKRYVTQPALTTQVKNLEEELGVMIFDRTKKPIIPTTIGMQIIEQAKEVSNQSRKLHDLVGEYQKVEKGDLSIGIIPTISPYLVPLFINNFSENNKEVNISVAEEITEQIVHKLKNGQLDVGIIATPIESTGIVTIPLYYEKFYGYVSRSNSDYHKSDINIGDLDINDLWLLKEGNCFRDQVMNICKQSKKQVFRDHFRFESHSIESLKRIVEAKDGMTLIPELSLATISPKNMDMVKEISGVIPVREVSLVVTRQFLKRRMIDRLMYSIQDCLPEVMKVDNGNNIISTSVNV
ncbi:MAG: LysR family hydrogen peroxide-inducible transcriptional activator [Salibacteraceae bacterium]|jgi:LysR family hydrogen peroxide-inducible transcriptional activator